MRQLVYDFRQWRSLEAVGRAGADEGIDIRATEFVGTPPVAAVRVSESEPQSSQDVRLWIIQCKREKAIGPAEIPTIVEASVPEGNEPPYGFILAASATFSKRSRDVFAKQCQRRDIKEFYLWGNGEIEDMLLDTKHAHLLFLYFDITIAGVFGRSRELANLRWELSDNIAALVMKSKDAPLLHTLWADSLRRRIKLDAVCSKLG